MKRFLIKNYKLFFIKLAGILAFTMSVAGFLLVFYPLKAGITDVQKIVMILGSLLVNVIIAYSLSLPKLKITLNVTPKVKVNVYYGDLFQVKTNIVIPFNENFDTLVDNEVISANTLHGKFINGIYGANVEKLNRVLEEKLKDIPYIECPDRSKGRTRKYPLGTTVHVEEGGKKYFLFVLSNFDKDHKASSSNKDYQLSIHSLLNYIHNHSQGDAVNIPLIGAGQSGIKLTKQELLEYLMFSIRLHENLTVSGGINIILHPSLRDEIDLNKIEYVNKIQQ